VLLGGSALNAAAALARLGTKTAILSACTSFYLSLLLFLLPLLSFVLLFGWFGLVWFLLPDHVSRASPDFSPSSISLSLASFSSTSSSFPFSPFLSELCMTLRFSAPSFLFFPLP